MKEMRRVIGGVDVILQVANDWAGGNGKYEVRWAKMGNEAAYLRTGRPADTFEWATSEGHDTEDAAIKAAYTHIAKWDA